MRILAIRGKNLASLRGEFALELNQPPLAQAGLFAITGHTGAGKSTLLDALCLALFDKVPRLIGGANVKVGHADEDEKVRIGSTDVGSILSRGSAQGYAEVDFVGMDKHRYRAHWEIKRARNKVTGRLQKQSLILTDLESDKIIGQNKSDTLDAISARIGLNFEQFRRSVLLPQGDFSAFLKARSEERSALLERITGTEIYSQLSIAAYRRFQEQEQHLNRIKDKLSVDMPLKNEQRQDLLIAIQALEDDLTAVRENLEKNQALLQWHEIKTRLAEEVSSAEISLAGLQQQQKDKAEQRNELKQVESVQSFRPLCTRLDELDRKKQQLDAQLVQEKSAQDLAEAREQELKRQWQQTQQKLHECQTSFEALKPEFLQARELDTQIRLLRQECAMQQTQMDELNRELHLLRDKQRDSDELISEQRTIEQSLAAINEQLQTRLAERQSISLDKLTREKEQLNRRIDNYEQASDIYQSHVSKLSELESRNLDIELVQRTLLQHGQELQEVQQQQTDVKIACEEAKRALLLMQETVTQGAQSLRSLLNEEQPCPVCGSREHPWAEQNSHLQQQYQQQKSRVEELEKSLQKLSHDINRLQQANKYSATEKEKAQQQKQTLLTELKNLEHNWQEQWQQIWQQLQQDNRQENRMNTEGQRDLLNADNANYLHTEIVTVNEALARLKQQEQQAIRIQQSIDDLQTNKEQLHQQEKALSEMLSEQRLLSQSMTNLERQIKNNRADLDKRVAQEHSLTTRRQQLLSGDNVDDVETRMNQDIKQLSEQCDAEKQQLEKARQQKVSSAQECHSLYLQLQANDYELKKNAQLLQTQLQQLSLDRIQLQSLLAKDAAWIQSWQTAFKQLDNDIIKAETLLAERRLKMQQHEQQLQSFEKALQEQPVDVLQQQWQAMNAQLQTVQSRHQGKLLELKQDEQRKQRMLACQDELEAQLEQWRQWGAINELIGSASGNKFRVFAQSLTLESLLAHANLHLDDFARRYQLQRVPGSDLDIQIVDRDMADEVRSVQSLSGGESFLVSLALALGLASLSSAKTQVESLFIDEGFGTLDQETLDIAIASLDSLQAMGRKVGIISHVPILVERIGTRVLVKKMGGGQSRVIIEG